MSFQHSAIGDNTPENREHLERLGITKTIGIVGNTIMVVDGRYMCFELEGNIGNNFNDAVNCIGNDPLFQAVTAIREDIDLEQYFTNRDGWILCTRYSFGDYAYIYGFKPNKWHKASLAELQDRFK